MPLNHQQIDARSLEYSRLIAEKLRRDPALIERARQNLVRWSSSAPRFTQTYREWQALLDGPFDVLLETLVGENENSTRLRQSSPFSFVLSPEERKRIFLKSLQHAAVRA